MMRPSLHNLILIIVIVFTSVSAWAENTTVFAKDTKFYHWGPREQDEWASKGFPNDNELKERIRLQHGYFVSANPMDSSSYGPSLIVFEAKKELQIEKDIKKIPVSDEWYSLQEPLSFLNPHLGSLSDIYSSDLFISGKMKLYDFMRIDASFKLIDSPAMKKYYPLISKLVSRTPINTNEKKSLIPDLIEAAAGYPSITERIGPTAFGENLIKGYRPKMIEYFAVHGLPTRFKDANDLLKKNVWEYYLRNLKISPEEIVSYRSARFSGNSGCNFTRILEELIAPPINK